MFTTNKKVIMKQMSILFPANYESFLNRTNINAINIIISYSKLIDIVALNIIVS